MKFRVLIVSFSFLCFGCPSQPSYERPTWKDIGASKDEVASITSKCEVYIQLASDLSGDLSILADKADVAKQSVITQQTITRLGIAAIGTANK